MAQKAIDQRKAIENLQRYLREISYYDSDIPAVPIDGIYESATKQAVTRFQVKYGIAPNGIVDKKTWDTVYRIYKRYISAYGSPSGIFPFPNMRPGFRVEKDEESDLVMLVQIMLNTIKLGYDDLGEFKVNGVHDEASMYAVKQFQRRNFLPQTGLVDKDTWNSLAAGYNKYIKIN